MKINKKNLNIFYMNQRGFTLLEILVAVAIVSILAGIVIVAMNPMRQLSVSRDYDRLNAVQQLYNALHQYYIDHGRYPAAVNDDSLVYEMCNTNIVSDRDCGRATLNVRNTVPDYLPAIPTDPYLEDNTSTGYRVAINNSSGVYVEAPNTEIGVGPLNTVIFIGRPPVGYDIPTTDHEEEPIPDSTSVSTYVNVVEEKIPWIKYFAIFVLGIWMGYKGAQKKYTRPQFKKAPPPIPTVFKK